MRLVQTGLGHAGAIELTNCAKPAGSSLSPCHTCNSPGCHHKHKCSCDAYNAHVVHPTADGY